MLITVAVMLTAGWLSTGITVAHFSRPVIWKQAQENFPGGGQDARKFIYKELAATIICGPVLPLAMVAGAVWHKWADGPAGGDRS